jgi:hypothetical protein
MTLSITTLCIMTITIMTFNACAQCWYAECRNEVLYAECHYTDCCFAECRGALTMTCSLGFFLLVSGLVFSVTSSGGAWPVPLAASATWSHFTLNYLGFAIQFFNFQLLQRHTKKVQKFHTVIMKLIHKVTMKCQCLKSSRKRRALKQRASLMFVSQGHENSHFSSDWYEPVLTLHFLCVAVYEMLQV